MSGPDESAGVAGAGRVAEVLARLASSARAVARAEAPGLDELDETDAARRALAALARAGLLSWNVPRAFGGADARPLAEERDVSVRALCAVRRELAWGSGMLDVMFVMQGLGSYAVSRAGSDEQRARWLPGVARGEQVAAFALTENDAGSDLSSIATRARRTGRGWRLEGGKTFISNCGIASFYTLLARTSGEPGDGRDDGLSMFLVPADRAGLGTRRFEVTAPHPIGELELTGVELDGDALLGSEGGGLEVALAVLGRFRATVAAAATGFARRALDESMARLEGRRQFGKPLSSFQGLRFDVAEMDVRLRAAELLVQEAAQAVDRGERAVLEVARAKLYATECASWIADRAVQHFGGLGVRRGQVVERLWREVRALRIYEGTSEVQRSILARELFAAQRAPRHG